MATRVVSNEPVRVGKGRGLVEPSESSAEPFRTLRVSLELRPDARRGNIIVFTSAEAGEGKSTIAANYALVSAVNERSVVVIDMDLRNPSLHETFGLPRAPGLTEVIVSRLDLRTIAHPMPGVPGLSVITAGTSVPRAGDITGSNTVRDLLTRASEEFDIVVIDTPPVLLAADAAHIAAHPAADVAFVVAPKQRVRPVRRALAKLTMANANVLGFVLNREGRLSDYGYG